LLSFELLIERCTFRGNRCELGDNNTSGGGMHLSSGYATLKNCLIYDNYSTYGGGGIYKFAPSPANTGILTLVNCTIASNVAPSSSAIYFRRFDSMHMCNTVIYSNLVGISSSYAFYFTNSWIQQRDVTNGVNGEGNITNGLNPAFVDVEGNNFRLTAGSPCINTGVNQPWTAGAIDLDGRERVRYGTVDMGAYEYVYEGTVYMLR